jgi:hypothetical protein
MPLPIGGLFSPVRYRAPVSSPVFARPDPLAVSLANGTSFTPVDRSALAAEAGRALKLGADVPGRVQDGPTCGLYALGMVMDYWEKQNPKNGLDPLVQASDAQRSDSHSLNPDTKQLLLDEAKKAGFTTQGEMFYGRQLAQLAQKFGYRADVTPNVTLDEIDAAVDKHHPVLVPFDVDNSGNPGLFGGKRAHWAVIEGHFEKDGVKYLVATHGWTGKEYVWRADDFMKSVSQLDQSDFPGAPKDITGTLRGLMIEVTPR